MKTIIGIDLGTTNSAVAFMDGDEPRVIPNERGSRITPSVVAFTESGDVLVGESAKNQAIVNAGRTVTAVKRTMGSGVPFEIGSRGYLPEEISSFILTALRRQAEEFLGSKVTDAVITVPAHFSEAQRRATQEAGRLAGLRVARILNEPTAAALAYAFKTPGDRRILVYDLGGGTFDVTCLEKHAGDFRVLATEGDNHLGGIDFDRLLLDQIIGKFEAESGVGMREEPVLLQQLSALAEQAKIELSTQESAQIALPFFGAGRSGPLHLSYSITREQFNALIERPVQRTVKLTMKAVKLAGFGIRGVDSLVLSGGSSRIPLVHSYLRRALNLERVALVNPDEIVAMGAAVQAGILARDGRSTERIEVHDVMPYNLGVEIEGGQFVTVLPRNSAIPARTQRVFTTVSDEQSSVEIHVLQGDRPSASENASLGRFLLSGIRRGKQGEPRVRVLFTVDVDGLVWVSARDVDTGAEQEIRVTPSDPGPERTGRSAGRGESAGFDVGTRVELLSRRLSELFARERSRLDEAFIGEIEEILSLSRKALQREDKRSLHECHLALETVIGELHVAMRTVEGSDDGR